jgi:hypothetical protein
MAWLVVLKIMVRDFKFLIHGPRSSAILYSFENTSGVESHQVPALNPMVGQDTNRLAVLTHETNINSGTVIQNTPAKQGVNVL